MRYWSFQSNPTLYRIEAAVRELVTDSWATKGHDIRKGDRAIIWKAVLELEFAECLRLQKSYVTPHRPKIFTVSIMPFRR